MITNEDFINILEFYKMEIPKSHNLLKQKATTILANKLCRCIKKLNTTYKSKSVGICTKSIFNKKGLKRGTFRCNKQKTVTFRKIKNNKQYTKKNIKK